MGGDLDTQHLVVKNLSGLAQVIEVCRDTGELVDYCVEAPRDGVAVTEIDLIVVDMHAMDDDERETLEQLRVNVLHRPVILVARGGDGGRCGLVGIMAKPYELKAVLPWIYELLL